MNDIDALIDLLRRLAGRLPDGALATFRSLLAARELEDLERVLVPTIHYYGIGLTPSERAILPAAGVGSVPDGAAPVPRFVAADPDGSRCRIGWNSARRWWRW